MKMTIRSTSKIVTVVPAAGTPYKARVWEGHTESGIAVHCFITTVATLATNNLEEFERELQEHAPPSLEIDAFPLRMIL